VREILGANFLEEHALSPHDKPTTLGPDGAADGGSDQPPGV
jgi:hypothetical protein